MSDNDIRVGVGFPLGQLARALTTARTHEDVATRERAELRVRRWQQIVDGMAEGRLDIGSRTPVRGLPAWVTPEVTHGGFATGEPAAGGPLRPDETDRAQRLGLPADRRALFWSWLTDAGLAELGELLDSGRYRLEYAEEAALPVVAWLLRSGDRGGALGVLEQIAPFADRLPFTPAPSNQRAGDPDVVYRQTAGDVRRILEQRQPNAQIETMREALTVWNPFADELLTLWCETRNGDRISAVTPDGWLPRAVQLLARYQHLATEHILCTRHRSPRGSIGVLRTALERPVAGAELTPRERGLVQNAVRVRVRQGTAVVVGHRRTGRRRRSGGCCAGPGCGTSTSGTWAGSQSRAQTTAWTGRSRSRPAGAGWPQQGWGLLAVSRSSRLRSFTVDAPHVSQMTGRVRISSA